MSPLEIGVVALVSCWLAALTVAVVIVVRQVAILGFRLDRVGGRAPAGADGLDIGRRVPDFVLEALPQTRLGVAYVLITSATCAPCREIAPQLSKIHVPEPVIALVPGGEDLASSLIALMPPWVKTVRDPLAAELSKALQVQYTPFAMEIEAGYVTARAYLHSAADLEGLSRVRRSGERKLPITLREAIEHARLADGAARQVV